MSMPDSPERRRSAWESADTLAPAPPKRRLASDDLLAGRDEVIIEHAGQEYHLRRTRAGKLILTK
ncbi:MAG: hemin uptake protein HemP [Gammaproteobacteria bacterium]